MKNILLLPSKMIIKVSTIITIFIALLINRHRLLFLQYLMAFVHETSHCIGAIIFKININSITFLPFGFYADMDNLYDVKWYKEIIIVLLGPLSFFVSYFLLKYLYINNYISFLLYSEASKTNLFILIFNLLPIYPLDGYRIIKIIFGFLFSEKRVLKSTNIISLITTVFLLIYSFNNKQIFVISFLIVNQYMLFRSFKVIYRRFLVSKTIENADSRIKIHNLEDLYRPFNNYIIKNKKIYNEKEFSLILLNSNKKNG